MLIQEASVANFSDKTEVISDDTGFRMDLRAVCIGDAVMKWGRYTNPAEKIMTFCQEEERIVSHFQLSGSDIESGKISLREKQFMIYREVPRSHELHISPTKTNLPRSFFELIMKTSFFDQFSGEESTILKRFAACRQVNTFSSDFIAQTSPEMYGVIAQLQHAPYHGNLKKLFLEIKIQELFLLQVYQLDAKNNITEFAGLSGADTEKLFYIKEYIDLHFQDELSVNSLSKVAGINQSKLKSGFRKLFNTTVFGYVRDRRLEEAKRLLTEEKLNVNEAAYRVGYNYPHHFAAAFKKKFGLLPANFRHR